MAFPLSVQRLPWRSQQLMPEKSRQKVLACAVLSGLVCSKIKTRFCRDRPRASPPGPARPLWRRRASTRGGAGLRMMPPQPTRAATERARGTGPGTWARPEGMTGWNTMAPGPSQRPAPPAAGETRTSREVAPLVAGAGSEREERQR